MSPFQYVKILSPTPLKRKEKLKKLLITATIQKEFQNSYFPCIIHAMEEKLVAFAFLSSCQLHFNRLLAELG